MEQHVQVPTHQVIDVSPNDLLVYATLKRYDGDQTYPSLQTIIFKELGEIKKQLDNKVSTSELKEVVTDMVKDAVGQVLKEYMTKNAEDAQIVL